MVVSDRGGRRRAVASLRARLRETTPAVRVVVVLAVVLYLVGIAQSAFGADDTAIRRYLWGRVAIGVIAAVLVVVGIRRHRPATAGPWILLVAYIVVAVAGPVYELSRDLRPAGDLSGLVDVSVMLGVAAGMLWWIVRVRGASSSISHRIDIGVLVTAFLALQIHVGWVPGVLAGTNPLEDVTLGVVAPVGNLVIFVLLMRLLLIDDITGWSFLLLAIGFGSMTVPTSLSALFAHDGAVWRVAIDCAPLTLLLFAAAALDPSMTRITAPGRTPRPEWSIARCTGLVVVVALPIGAALAGPRPGTVETLCILVLVIASILLLVIRAKFAVSAWQASERRIRDQAVTDSLTGTLNRTGVEAFAAGWGDLAYGVALIDLKAFNRLNDAHGYGTGDQVLSGIARRLQHDAPLWDGVGRLSGDQFVAFFRGSDVRVRGEEVAGAIRERLREPLEINGGTVTVTAAIGLADTLSYGSEMVDRTIETSVTSDRADGTERADTTHLTGGGDGPPGLEERTTPGETFQRLLRRADFALRSAKRENRPSVQFTSRLEQSALRELQISDAMDHAVADGTLHAVYQGVYDLRTLTPTGAEALLRLTHPRLGPIGPEEFIPLAERDGQIFELGDWILQTTIDRLTALRPLLPRGFRVSVNVSSRQLESRSFLDRLDTVLDDPVLRAALVFEITESSLAGAAAMAAVDRMAQAGGIVAIDDFGTGYASLQYLSRLPVRVLKIDRSFVSRLDQDGPDRAVVRRIISLAEDLGISTVAEGIETEQQAELLRSWGCARGQGFLWDRPAPALERFVVAGQPAPVPLHDDRTPVRHVRRHVPRAG